MFVTWCFEYGASNIGKDSPTFRKGNTYAYVPYMVSDARSDHNGLTTLDPDQVIPGDLVCYDWSWDGEYDHVGIFERWTGGGAMDVIEGNTSPSNDSNGGEVMRRNRLPSTQGTVFVRVSEP
jgi:hypothetical protein